VAPPGKNRVLPGIKVIDEMMFKKRKKWERRERMLKRAEARSTTASTRVKNTAAIDTCTSRMKKLESDIHFLQDERQALDNSTTSRKIEKMKKSGI